MLNKSWLPKGTHAGLQITHRQSAREGLTLYPGKPKIVLHTFESDNTLSAASMHRYLEGTGNVAHLCVNLRDATVYQALPFHLGSYVLKNAPGGAETNRTGKTVQIEIAGRAANTPQWTYREMSALAAVMELINHRIDCGRSMAAFGKSNRYSATEWPKVTGIIGHRHVPENDHTDPGNITRTQRSYIQAAMRKV